jgi:hypothetical protein
MSNKKPKFKFGDRVEFEGNELYVVHWDSNDNRYYLASNYGSTLSRNLWVYGENLTLLPKTRNEILKDMIDGYEFECDFARYRFRGSRFKQWNHNNRSWHKCSLDQFDDAAFLAKLKRNPPRGTLKSFGILDLEITEEQAKKIKEVIEGVSCELRF